MGPNCNVMQGKRGEICVLSLSMNVSLKDSKDRNGLYELASCAKPCKLKRFTAGFTKSGSYMNRFLTAAAAIDETSSHGRSLVASFAGSATLQRHPEPPLTGGARQRVAVF